MYGKSSSLGPFVVDPDQMFLEWENGMRGFLKKSHEKERETIPPSYHEKKQEKKSHQVQCTQLFLIHVVFFSLGCVFRNVMKEDCRRMNGETENGSSVQFFLFFFFTTKQDETELTSGERNTIKQV